MLLVLRALGLGDLLTAVPALRALARAFPQHRRVLAMPAALAPLAELICDEHGTPCFEPLAARPLRPLPARVHGAAVAVNLHGRGPQSHRILRATAPGRLVAFAHPAIADHAGPQWRAGEHEVARWCRLLEESGIAADPCQLAIARSPREPPACARGATVLHPGAASGARQWPAARWATVARARRRRGHRLLVTGSESERDRALQVARAARLPREDVLAGRTDLLDLAAIVGAAALVVCGDTGVAHLATALGTPSVVLFGPVSPAEWGPPPLDRHRVLWAGLRGDPHASRPARGLLAISPADVMREIDALAS